MKRPNGYYWTKTYEGVWIVSLYQLGFWCCAGYQSAFNDEAFDEIGRMVLDYGPDYDDGSVH